MTERGKIFWAFFLDENGEFAYDEKCGDCDMPCKQSFRVQVYYCPYHKKLLKERKKVIR